MVAIDWEVTLSTLFGHRNAGWVSNNSHRAGTVPHPSTDASRVEAEPQVTHNDPEQYAGGSGWVGIPTMKLRKRGTKRHLVPLFAQYYRLRKHIPKTIRMSFSIHEMVLAVIEVSIKSICSTTESALRLMAIIENRIKYGRNYFYMVIYPFYEWWLTGLSLICLKPIGNSEVLRG